MDAFVLCKLFLEKHLVLGAKTTRRLQKPLDIKNTGCKFCLANKKQKAIFLVVFYLMT